MTTYFTADPHFGHKNIIRFCNRPFADVEEMDEALIANWNAKVKAKDQIYILGDLTFGRGRHANEILSRLNGTKFFIRGNHDGFLTDPEFEQKHFAWVKEYHMLKQNDMKFALFHYPIAIWDCQHHGAIHLYGHVHNNPHPLLPQLVNAYNVGVDVNNYEPVSMEEIIDSTQRRGSI